MKIKDYVNSLRGKKQTIKPETRRHYFRHILPTVLKLVERHKIRRRLGFKAYLDSSICGELNAAPRQKKRLSIKNVEPVLPNFLSGTPVMEAWR